MLDDLAAHDQATLYFQLWHVASDTRSGVSVPDTAPELDVAQPWTALVDVAHRRAVTITAGAALKADVVATIEWIDESDR
ncbi:hypothetical protein ACIOD2_35960 [Amycolatopsis sp. NPDC088138]|uniref:hypothetical protein n=1 Tax=Amycolatopsis sp. NPDC088138 TaxID=3363938 RepID=UPI0037F73714